MKKDSLEKCHVQVPNDMCHKYELNPLDMLVYANIKRFMNRETREAWPSILTLQKVTGLGRDRLLASIDRLNGKYFKFLYVNGKRRYLFPHKNRRFEPFSLQFLDKQDLSPLEKSYIMAAQQYMFKDHEGLGKMGFKVKDLSNLINMSEWNIYKCDNSLQEKGYLDIVPSQQRDFDTGLPLSIKVFNMELLGQAIIWKLKGSYERIMSDAKHLKQLERNLKLLKKQLLHEKQLRQQENKSSDYEIIFD
jgi:hypothetical protein|uniref:Helix-turn-helix domain protein n=1 Tax=Podoviridae sp. ctz6O13 TaxID=2827757 RepID=A0A8S5TK80_9CAUD|nr:MAG TPA: helix-turn-helix domain protein [Podoviridae sp. ctz6O13]